MGTNSIVGSNGLGDKNPVNKTEVTLCKKWILKWVTQRKKINFVKGSYGLKHAVERTCNRYISNGAFIQAALDIGFSCKENGMNAFFGMSFVQAQKNKDSKYYAA